MKILITSNSLAVRAGTESFVRDLARGLESWGHSVMVYGSAPDQGERLLERDVVPVATALESLPFRPDVIHALHPLDAMTALLSLPGVPAIFHGRGTCWQGCPPIHPRIYRYTAASMPLAGRLAGLIGVAPGDILLFPDPVDPAKFATVRSLPAHPSRALWISSFVESSSDLGNALHELVSSSGMTLDRGGEDLEGGNENILPTYDLVFASGQAAVDAMASGCAVIVADHTGCGEMVEPGNFDRLRSRGFSPADASPSRMVEQTERALRCYSPETCALVTKRLRRESDFSLAVGEWTGIYESVMEEHRNSPQNFRAELLAASRYLRKSAAYIMQAHKLLGGRFPSSVPRSPEIPVNY